MHVDDELWGPDPIILFTIRLCAVFPIYNLVCPLDSRKVHAPLVAVARWRRHGCWWVGRFRGLSICPPRVASRSIDLVGFEHRSFADRPPNRYRSVVQACYHAPW